MFSEQDITSFAAPTKSQQQVSGWGVDSNLQFKWYVFQMEH